MDVRKSFKLATYVAVGLAVATLASAQATGVLFVKDDQVLIGDDTAVTGAKLAVKSATVGPVDAIFLQNSTGPARIKLLNLAQTNTATTDQKWTINSNGNLRFTAGSDGPEMTIDAAGNLVVQSSITVAGTPINVPDYVFEPDYNLMPLNELRSFVETNRHLPEVPSGDEVAKHGLDMTAMQLRLLQKVEELTLYTLQQQGTIERLTAKIDTLEQKNR